MAFLSYLNKNWEPKDMKLYHSNCANMIFLISKPNIHAKDNVRYPLLHHGLGVEGVAHRLDEPRVCKLHLMVE